MPTTLVERTLKPRVDLFALFVVCLTLAFFAIEVADPAPIEIEASTMSSL